MSITNGYGDLRGYKLRYFDGDTDDSTDDQIIEDALEEVSRKIDKETSRRFYVQSETRYFTAQLPDYLNVPDIQAISGLWTDEAGARTYADTWATTDYDLLPFNAQADTADPEPYTAVEITPNGSYTFPKLSKGVKITASWGYASSIPAMITEACYLGAHRVMKRHPTPLGISAAPNLGQLQVRVEQLRTDPDFMAMIAPFVRMT